MKAVGMDDAQWSQIRAICKEHDLRMKGIVPNIENVVLRCLGVHPEPPTAMDYYDFAFMRRSPATLRRQQSLVSRMTKKQREDMMVAAIGVALHKGPGGEVPLGTHYRSQMNPRFFVSGGIHHLLTLLDEQWRDHDAETWHYILAQWGITAPSPRNQYTPLTWAIGSRAARMLVQATVLFDSWYEVTVTYTGPDQRRYSEVVQPEIPVGRMASSWAG